MSSYNILSAIKVIAAALADAGYVEEAQPYIRALNGLFDDLDAAIKQEKTASTVSPAGAAKGIIPPVLSSNDDDLSSHFVVSSYYVGQMVHTPDGDGRIFGFRLDGSDNVAVDFGFNNCCRRQYNISDITPF